MTNVRNGNQFGRDMRQAEKELAQLFGNKLERHAAANAEKLTQENFDGEQFDTGKVKSKWKKLKSNGSDKERGNRGGILVKSGRLRRSVETEIPSNGTVILRAGYEVGGKWNLAQIHNEGFAPVPRRQFMPEPGDPWPALDHIIDTFMADQMDRIFN